MNNLGTFLAELFNEDHEGDARLVKDAVLLFQTGPTPDLVIFLNEHPKAHQFYIIRGSAFDQDDLVVRCHAESASGIFVLIDQQASVMNVVDAEVVMIARAVSLLTPTPSHCNALLTPTPRTVTHC